ncbi:MAG TPA: TonB-dependent receptor, partial [Bacteroidetes bacterium]|nr:TonB-dependent receptor [Bacteroidota bacterium]
LQLPVSGLFAQALWVQDAQTRLPIARVLIYNTSRTASTLTNAEGKAVLSMFAATDTLIFQHPAYETRKIPFQKIGEMQGKILLATSFIDLNEVIVSANRWEEKKNEIPNRISQITRKDILLENPPTAADMLAESHDVFVQKSQLGGGSPMIRGFAANRVLLVVDGVRMNNAIYRSGNLQNILQADVNSIQNAEIIFGPGTNIYGSDALGGVMDIYLLSPKLYETKRWEAHGNVYGRMGSAAFEKTVHTDVNVANNSWGFLTSISLTDFDDLRMGSHPDNNYQRPEYVVTSNILDSIVPNSHPNVQKFSGYSQLNFLQKIKHKFNNYSKLTLGLYYSATSDVPRYDRLTQYSGGHLKYAQWYYQPQSWFMSRAALSLLKKRKAYNRALLVIAYQKIQEGRNDRKYRDPWLRKRKETVAVYSAYATFNKQLSASQNIYYGFSFDANQVNSAGRKENIHTGEQVPAASRYPDGGTQTFHTGLYVSYKKNMQKAPLTLLSGIRFTLAALSSQFADTNYYHLPYMRISLFNQALTGSFGIVYRPAHWQFRINLSSGFRAPNLDDVAKIFDSEPGNVVVPNENLKPEYLYNTELGFARSLQNKTDLEITFFYSYLYHALVRRNFQLNGRDSIVYDGELSRVQAMVNAGYATIYGISFATDISLFPHWGLRAKITYIQGNDDEGFALRHVPPVYGNAALVFQKNKINLFCSVNFNGQISYNA